MESKTMADILVVEDEADIANLVRLHLEMLGHRVLCCDTLAYGRRALESREWALLVLDLSLPDGDGLGFCRALRDADAALPILMLTARSSEHDRVRGLETGADDYLAKPFGVLELQARVRALLRRASLLEPSAPVGPLEVPPLRLDPARRAATRDGEALELTATEFDLLAFLARQPGVVFSRQQLLSEVWGYHHEGYEHTVNSHINRLRAKIERDPSHPRLIRTVWGVGYTLDVSEAA
ncbi:MAG: response regulator transcription factor [Rhodocyclaceae bacterium]|nr:response regulator transcription factor [Rhodocyclaceae bacterium]